MAAKAIGIRPAHLGEFLKGTRDPGPTILRHSYLEREIIYRKTKARQSSSATSPPA